MTDYVARARTLYTGWATENPDSVELADGSSQVKLNRTRRASGKDQRYEVERTISLRSLDGDDSYLGFEGITRETSEGMTWTTVVRVLAGDKEAHVWIENQVESERLVGVRLSVGRPRIVDDLLNMSPKAQLGASRLQVDPVSIPAEGVPLLIEQLQSEHRTLPIIVVSQPDSEDNGSWQSRAQRIARRVSGIAVVITLDRNASEKFSREFGQLATWDGSIRVYVPVPVIEGEGYRHRYTLRTLLEDPLTGASQLDRIVFKVCSISARRRPDPVFDRFLSMDANTTVDLSDYMSLDDAEVILKDLQSKLDAAHNELSSAIEDQEQLSQELNLKTNHLNRLHQALKERNIFDLFYETQHDLGSGIPDDADNVETAILLAMDYLGDWLVLHADAPRDLDGINTAPQSTAWGNTAWRGFRALAAFATARGEGFAGSFYDWCKSDPPMGWPTSPKKLAMTESNTVQNNPALSGKRILPVSRDVDPTERILMLSHLKIAEGGGNLAPRIYFYDDTSGSTGKVHVGFVGPHVLMPNTRS